MVLGLMLGFFKNDLINLSGPVRSSPIFGELDRHPLRSDFMSVGVSRRPMRFRISPEFDILSSSSDLLSLRRVEI